LSERTGLFQGSELSKLVALATIMVAGWALFFAWGGPKAAPPRPAAPADAPLPPADPSPAFESVTDKTTIQLRDMAAYAELLERARGTSPAALSAQSRRDVVFPQLLERPDRYRGLPIHLQGTVRRIVVQDDISPELSPKGRLYEAWIFTPDSQRFPYVLIFEDLPPGLSVGDQVHELVAFDGYFLKLLAYQAADIHRFAPMLIGRMTGNPPAASSRPGGTSRSPVAWMMGPLFLLMLYGLVRWGFRLRRALAPRVELPKGISPVDEIAPEDLSRWLEKAPRAPGDTLRNGEGSHDDI
jgi:hypothetical protein